MGKVRKHRYKVFWLLAVGALLTGCLGKKYEPIEEAYVPISSDEEQQKAEEPIVIEQEETSREAVEEESPQRPETEEPRELTLLFGGDVLLSSHVLSAYDKAGGIGGVVDEGYREQIDKADFFLVNQEFPFSDRGVAAEDKQYTFRLPPGRVSLFQELGIDGVTLANNHALDFGTDALLDSCAVLDDAGILHTGAGANLEEAKRPVAVEIGGKRMAVIGATRVIPVADWAAAGQHPGMLAAYDLTALLEEIRIQRQENDFVAVYVHWGVEREDKPEEYQRTMARQIIDAGADLVVGAHPHVLQGVEYYQGKPIVYSLGNFIFGSSIPRTALLEMTWEEEKTPVFRLFPGTSQAGYTRMLTDEAQREEFFRYIEGISFGVSFSEDGVMEESAD